jgi:hypothetical protein
MIRTRAVSLRNEYDVVEYLVPLEQRTEGEGQKVLGEGDGVRTRYDPGTGNLEVSSVLLPRHVQTSDMA